MISPIDIATQGYLCDSVSVATDGYICIEVIVDPVIDDDIPLPGGGSGRPSHYYDDDGLADFSKGTPYTYKEAYKEDEEEIMLFIKVITKVCL